MILDHERLIYYMNQMKVASYHTTWSVSKIVSIRVALTGIVDRRLLPVKMRL